MAWTTTGIYGTSLDVDVTVMANEVLASSTELSVLKRLVRNRLFTGPGKVVELPTIDAVTFSSHTENAEITTGTPDLNVDSVTVTEYTSDYHVSNIAAKFGGADSIKALAQEQAIGYAKAVDGLISTAIGAATSLDIDHNGTMTVAHVAAAYAALAAIGAPQPYYLALKPSDYQTLFGGTGLAIANAAGPTPLIEGPSPQWYVGQIGGMFCYVAPWASKTHFFSQQGVEWVYKMVDQPAGMGELVIGLDWRSEWRAYNLYATHIGAAVARNPNATYWCGNIYNVA